MENSFVAFAGVDVGSSHTKMVVLDEQKKIIAWAIKKSGTDLANTSWICLQEVMAVTNLEQDNFVKVISTGYGRDIVSFADYSRTEITCHARGCFHYFPLAIDIIDIGGQDNKIIKLDSLGKRKSFKMNRKCAAGTGSFLEEMAFRLDIAVEGMNQLASSAEGMITLGSFCAVFSATEVLENIRLGRNVADIVKGLFFSVLKRIAEMDSFSDRIVMTGGVVAHNPYLAEMAGMFFDRKIFLPDYPQLTGALGAALYAMD